MVSNVYKFTNKDEAFKYLTSPLCMPVRVLERRVYRMAGSPDTEHIDTSTAADNGSCLYRLVDASKSPRHRCSFSKDKNLLTWPRLATGGGGIPQQKWRRDRSIMSCWGKSGRC